MVDHCIFFKESALRSLLLWYGVKTLLKVCNRSRCSFHCVRKTTFIPSWGAGTVPDIHNVAVVSHLYLQNISVVLKEVSTNLLQGETEVGLRKREEI